MVRHAGSEDRLHVALAGLDGLTAKAMMGGLCFLLDGNMICGADCAPGGGGRFMFRIGKARAAEALKDPAARIVELGGRRMGGFVFVDAARCDDTSLGAWVAQAIDHVRTLPPK